MIVRAEQPGDVVQVRQTNECAFGRAMEAALVDLLRMRCAEAMSLVADEDGGVVGHILFTPVTVDGHHVRGMGLAPMAVRPERQREGIGSRLVVDGLAALRVRGVAFAIVLGHPAFYPRFGFEPASRRGLRSQWHGVPDEAFMVCVLDEPAMAGVQGIARYRPEFEAAERDSSSDAAKS